MARAQRRLDRGASRARSGLARAKRQSLEHKAGILGGAGLAGGYGVVGSSGAVFGKLGLLQHADALLGVAGGRLKNPPQPVFGLRRKAARAISQRLPRGLRRSRVVRSGLELLRRGRKMGPLFHITAGERAGRIAKEGLRPGKGGQMGGGEGRVFVGRGPAVLFHRGYHRSRLGKEAPAYFEISGLRRGDLMKDFQHAGAYIHRKGGVSARMMRRVSGRRVALRAAGNIGKLGAIGALGGYGLSRATNRWELKTNR